MSENTRERDLVLAPNEYAFILDETKGHVIAYVGPFKTSLANTDRPVIFEELSRKFKRCSLEEAITQFPFAEEGWYIVLENPVKEGDEEHPKSGPASLPRLAPGRKVNIPGPVTFPLWPGQVAHVIQGHHLRSNHYLVIRVYNEEAARDNWAKAVIKPQKASPAGAPDIDKGKADDSGKPAGGTTVKPDVEIPDLTIGKLLVVKGTDVSFYIPPTGIEVVRDENGNYVREAVTLERLEYCILLDEDGNKRFIEGPAVVFPRPTERFVEKSGARKFKAIELNEISGLYIKVIAPYRDEKGTEYKVGDELFITGKDQMIYFPRPEHAIIKYGDQEIHFAAAIPTGEARYVLNRVSGEISLKRGPCMFLPDPRKEVNIQRILEPKIVQLYYPGNQEALEYNLKLMDLKRITRSDFIDTTQVKKEMAGQGADKGRKPLSRGRSEAEEAPDSFAGDDFNRKQGFTPPRTITMDTKYEGAVSINVWTGYAIMVVNRTGERKVVVGPQTHILEFDEMLEAMKLSTGTPKSDDNVIRTVYLRVLNNKVSDIVNAETQDLCQVSIQISYRVNFEGDPVKWFDVEDYVKFLTEHMRSVLRNAIKHYGIEEFYANSIKIIRDTILGTAGEESKRPGKRFDENGMRIYDVEVLGVGIGDEVIAGLLMEAQHSVAQQTISITKEQKNLEMTRRLEEIKQQISAAQSETMLKHITLEIAEVEKTLELSLSKIKSEVDAANLRLASQLEQQGRLSDIAEAELDRERKHKEQEMEFAQEALKQRIEELGAQVKAVVDKAAAVSPDFIAALQSFADKSLAEKMADTMAPLAILGGKSIAEVFAQLLKDTPLEEVIKKRAK
ncbi:MAG: SPFH domain-containing protein [Candidatus Eremiobacteraeota bacterium]|nr:SPFH domain-containing protein [Candidatus Eremiobacteraeota bacterium]